MQAKIYRFVRELEHRENSPGVTNPYLDPGVAENLRAYLRYMCGAGDSAVLLVGEAPGYRGCVITGIPFTSGRLFQRGGHPLLTALASRLQLRQLRAEATATMVWQCLVEHRFTPLLWNAYPFHPHPQGMPDKNRTPNAAELSEGRHYLLRLAAIYRPQLVAGIGRKGTDAASGAFPEQAVVGITHPSHGGKAEFFLGMNGLLRRARTVRHR